MMATLLALSGCAATPNLEYRAPGPDRDGFMKFTLPQTSVALTELRGKITATAVPDDDYPGAQQHSLMADAQWSLRTSSTITKWEFIEGQSVVKAIATTAESNVAKLLDVAKDVMSSAAGDAVATFKDDLIDPFTDRAGQPRALPVGSTVDCNLRRNPDWSCSIAIGTYPSWVIPYAQFRQSALDGDARKVFPSSACVSATIRLTGPARVPIALPGIVPATLPAAPGDAAAVTVGADGRLVRANASANMAGAPQRKMPEPPKPVEPAQRQELALSVELADPTFVNLTRLRSGGELQASGPCRFNVTNDKAGSNLDTQAFKDALALAKSLKAREK
jgi:hypothetical protein